MTLPPYMHHRLAAPTVAGAFDEYHRRLPKTTSLIDSDATRDLKAITALNNMGCLPNASVVKLCHDDRFMNLVCGILNTTDTHSHAPCSLTHPTTTTTIGATTITTARSEQQQDDVYDAMIDSYDAPVLGGEYTVGATMIANRSELANEVVETPLVSSTTVRKVSPDNNNMVGSSTHTTKKHKADEEEPAQYAPSPYLDGDSFPKFGKHCPILHLGGPPLGERLVAKKTKKTKTSTVGTSSSSAALDNTETLMVHHMDDVPTSSPLKNDPVDESFVLKTLHDPSLDDGRINPVHMIVREHVLDVRRSMSGKVFFQCKYCAHLPVHERAHQSTVSPQSINKLYRANVRFHMSHVRNCEYIPEWIKSCSPKKSRIGNSGGVKTSWEESAVAMGLVDDVERKCIVYCSKDDEK
jgi:hypothetical protein